MATFFDSFSAREIARISAHGRRVRLPEGWSPIWERTPADKAYIILDGSVSVRRGGTEIARLGAGDIVGEAAIVGRSLRTATVVALTPLSAIHFTDTDINELLEELPGFRDKLVALAQSRVGGAAAAGGAAGAGDGTG
ncbi:cyclic nucleotide-binding domain-containing protein [Nocardioides dongxiaopingii]|uniref:cyclic nucleotide-binding domain-containing protein n=1 Tax=Nocardioides sp. S-1144 TaxID=2582905 RepID=UPI00110F2D3E|nr:cyclic nucleotide-binding domain-containing protein [Nocardioides sp. S-1144]QCW49265.1 cyclic nucleotide-binding domain-containing protein [Nocardioides sp. S-1144]